MSGSRLRALRRSDIAKTSSSPASSSGRRRSIGPKASANRTAIRPALDAESILAAAAPLDLTGDALASGVVLVERVASLHAPLLVPASAGGPSHSIFCAGPTALEGWTVVPASGESVTCDNRWPANSAILRAELPVWHAASRRLYFRGVLVKEFRQPARNQELALGAFQLADWPEWIADPFMPDDAVDPHDRLYNTVKCLNRQRHALIEFSCDGRGKGIRWKPR
jgi:hypothetical protein